jgi:hypothetical protein
MNDAFCHTRPTVTTTFGKYEVAWLSWYSSYVTGDTEEIGLYSWKGLEYSCVCSILIWLWGSPSHSHQNNVEVNIISRYVFTHHMPSQCGARTECLVQFAGDWNLNDTCIRRQVNGCHPYRMLHAKGLIIEFYLSLSGKSLLQWGNRK